MLRHAREPRHRPSADCQAGLKIHNLSILSAVPLKIRMTNRSARDRSGSASVAEGASHIDGKTDSWIWQASRHAFISTHYGWWERGVAIMSNELVLRAALAFAKIGDSGVM